MKKVVAVAPTYREEENIAGFIDDVFTQKDKLKNYDLHLVIADSHSPDKTPELVKGLAEKNKNLHYLDVKERGLGLGLKTGLDYAVNTLKADIIITLEADRSADPAQFGEFLKKLETADLVVGSRYMKGGKIENWTWWRRMLSLSANNILRILSMAPNIHEFTNLYRAFDRKVWLKISPKVGIHLDWIFVPAFLFESLDNGFTVTEQPMVLHDRGGGRSKMNTISYTMNLMRYALRFRLKKSASFLKFLVVGTLGFIINTTILEVGVKNGMSPSVSGPLGAEVAILSNFIWNNLWTFSDRKLTSWKEIPGKFVQFNVLSFGSVIIQFVFLKSGEILFGLSKFKSPIIDLPFIRLITWYFGFYVAGVGVGLIWNFIIYSRVIWRKKGK